MINLLAQTIDFTSSATITRDLQALCRQVNEFIKNPSVLVQRTELREVIDSTDAVTLFVKIDYNMKSTGG